MRKTALWRERSSWDDHWRDISEHILPRVGRWCADEANRGHKKHRLIYDSTATGAMEILVAGMMAGATSPARPWMKLQTPDPDLNRYGPVEEWLALVSMSMLRVFNRSNTYRALPRYYQEMAAFGTSAGIITAHPTRVIHHYPQTVGQFAIAVDAEEEVNTLFREFKMTAAQMVEMFGKDRVSEKVRNCISNGRPDEQCTVIHAIEPRYDRDPNKLDGVNMPWRSVYFEEAKDRDLLLEEGFREFPVVAPRWSATGGDVYGSSPGMNVLGDVRALQAMARRKGQAIDYMTKPPVNVPPGFKGREANLLPGGSNEMVGEKGVESVFQPNLNLAYLMEDMQLVRERINRGFYADLFLMLANESKSMTATEVAERHEEKLTMLGPTLERVHNELLKPLASLTFGHMLDMGMVPPPPPELEEMELEVEFISMLAQAQQAVGASQDDRLLIYAQGLAALDPEVVDNIDFDESVRGYGSDIGVAPKRFRSPQEVADRRRERRAAQQAAAQAELLAQQAPAAKQIAEAEQVANEGAAASGVIDQFAGYSGV